MKVIIFFEKLQFKLERKMPLGGDMVHLAPLGYATDVTASSVSMPTPKLSFFRSLGSNPGLVKINKPALLRNPPVTYYLS